MSTLISEILQNVKFMKVMNLQKKFIGYVSEESHKLYVAYATQTFAKNCITIIREPIIVFFIIGGLFFTVDKSYIEFSQILVLAALFYRVTNSVGLWQQNLQNLIINENYFWSFMNFFWKASMNKSILMEKSNQILRI